MGNHEIRRVELPIKWYNPKHDTGQTGNEELEEEAETEQHRRVESDLTAPHRSDPIEDFDAGGHAHHHRGDRKERVAGRGHSDGEHVVRPNTKTDKRDTHRRTDHHRVAEDRFARKHRDDLRYEPEAGNNQDVYLRVAEDPEEVLPQHS